jgi:hypothetical protein
MGFFLAQRAATKLPAVGFASTMDIEGGEHPPDKQAVAGRLAMEVRRIISPASALPTKPVITNITKRGSSVIFTFDQPVASRNSSFGYVQPGALCGEAAQPERGHPDTTLIRGEHAGNAAQRAINYTISADGTELVALCPHPVRCAFSDRNLHSRMPLDPTHVHLKLLHACDRWHSSRESTPLTGWHCKSRPNSEGHHYEPVGKVVRVFSLQPGWAASATHLRALQQHSRRLHCRV